MRKFEKISFDQFRKDVKDDRMLYDNIVIPNRSTKSSAGYDFRSVEDGIIEAKKSKIFKTGIKASMNSDEVLYIYSRSSQGFKYNICLTNSVGVIDSDYYNNPDNEGHIQVKLTNLGDKDFEVKIGDKIAQGVFMKYLTVDDEEEVKGKRVGGLGSTGK